MKYLLLLALLVLPPFPAFAQEAEAPASVRAAPEQEPPAARAWTIDPAQSAIVFRGKQMGKDFEGALPAFTAAIYFDPGDLAASKVTVDITMLDIDAKDGERNKIVKGGDWFDVEQFPAARFETFKIAEAEDGGYVADATLTIRGVYQDIRLPFTLDFSTVEKGAEAGKDKAVMNGKVTLDRSKFQLGQGDWEDPSIIANEVEVDVKVTAFATALAKKDGADKPPSATP